MIDPEKHGYKGEPKSIFQIVDKVNSISMAKCKYTVHWKGKCDQKTIPGSEYCLEHHEKKCRVCGEQATHDCPVTISLVCGTPLCNEHTHKDHAKNAPGRTHS